MLKTCQQSVIDWFLVFFSTPKMNFYKTVFFHNFYLRGTRPRFFRSRILVPDLLFSDSPNPEHRFANSTTIRLKLQMEQTKASNSNFRMFSSNFFRNIICFTFLLFCVGVVWFLTSQNPHFVDVAKTETTSIVQKLGLTESTIPGIQSLRIIYPPWLQLEISESKSSWNSSIKILCLINTSRKQLKNRAIHVNATWAKRCDKYLFLSYDPVSLSFKIPISRGVISSETQS